MRRSRQSNKSESNVNIFYFILIFVFIQLLLVFVVYCPFAHHLHMLLKVIIFHAAEYLKINRDDTVTRS